MDRILYINTVPDIRIKEMSDTGLNKTKHDYSKDYLTFKILEDGKLTFNVNHSNWESIEASVDGGKTWYHLRYEIISQGISETSSLGPYMADNLKAGDILLVRGAANSIIGDANNPSILIGGTCKFEVSGNPLSVFKLDTFRDITELNDYCLQSMFDTSKVVTADKLYLGFPTLAKGCYQFMFCDCLYLTKAPKLTSKILAPYCYASMFEGCSSLNVLPVMSAEELADSCCYSMFQNCTSLTKAPILYSTTLATDCYDRMFANCSQLNYIETLALPIITNTSNWVAGVASSGTFVKNPNSEWDISANGIPLNWVIKDSRLVLFEEEYVEPIDGGKETTIPETPPV